MFPASFMLIGAMNPCPCGYYGDPFKQCACTPSVVSRYQHRISGPFLDRVDIFIEVPHIDCEELADDRLGEKSEAGLRSISRALFRRSQLQTHVLDGSVWIRFRLISTEIGRNSY